MTKDELVQKMIEARDKWGGDPEMVHYEWDDLLLEYIDDKRVTDMYDTTRLWYA